MTASAPQAYRKLLLLLPASFRETYGASMQDLFAHMLRERSHSRVRRTFLWTGALLDVLTHAGFEHMKRIFPGRRPRTRHGLDPRRGLATNLLQDVRYAVRGFLRAPGYALAFILTLGLGIGANTAIFSVVNGVLIRPLPYDDAGRLVHVEQGAVLSGFAYNASFSIPEIRDYERETTTITAIAEYSQMAFTLLGRDEPRRVRTAVVSGNFFTVMGVRAILGRIMDQRDDGADALPVAVLTQEFWTDVFDADSAAIGSTFQVNNRTVTVVGVLERIPQYPDARDLYVNTTASPHHLGAAMNHERDHRMTDIFARLRPDATLDAMRVELEASAGRMYRAYPDVYPAEAQFRIRAVPLRDALVRNARPTLYALMGTAAFVLAIACANVINLSLTRMVRRERELAIRIALGAPEGRIRRHLLVENTLLALCGAALSVVVAVLSLDVLVAVAARHTPRAAAISIDGTVLGFAVLMAGAVALALSLGIPVRHRPGRLLHEAGGRTSDSRRRRRVQRGLVVTQLAVSFVLLIGAGLLLETLVKLSRVDPGFDPEHVLTMELPLSGMDLDRRRAFFQDAIDRIEAHPGVRAVAVAMVTPLRGSPMTHDIRVEGRPREAGESAPVADFRSVSAGYFELVGMPVIRGRTFTQGDHADAPQVIVINQSMVDFYFPDADPIGRRIAWDMSMGMGMNEPGDVVWKTIVGVVADTRDYGLDQAALHAIFQPYAQEPWGNSLLVRAAGAPGAISRDVVRVIREVNPDQPIENVATLEQLKADQIAPRRVNATMFGAFAALALAIATVGVAGVLTFSVSQRRYEFGIRLTLGAERGRVLRMVLAEGLWLGLTGLLVGTAGALAFTRLLRPLLFEVSTSNPATYAAVAGLLLAVSLGAAWLPARRATGADPLEALRHE